MKLTLNDLEVQSFVTAYDLPKGETQHVRGGTWWENCDIQSLRDYSCWFDGGCDSGRCAEVTITFCRQSCPNGTPVY